MSAELRLSCIQTSEVAVSSDPIEHVVALVLENRSFDQVLGAFQAVYPELDGVAPHAPARTNRDDNGQEFQQRPEARTIVDPDPMHELVNVLRQIEAPAPDLMRASWWRRFLVWLARAVPSLYRIISSAGSSASSADPGITAAGYEGKFVLDFALAYPNSTNAARGQIMAYFPLDALPAIHLLARHFTICDHWHASVPGPTWANRLFLLSGTSLGIVRMPESWRDVDLLAVYSQPSIFDRLNERGVPWRVYHGDIPYALLLLNQLRPENAARYSGMSRFYSDARGPAAEFPAFAFIEPRYFGAESDDDHPPHDSMRAQALIARVYNALRGNAELWASTLFVLLYDEHGGFYDHVRPPDAVPPEQNPLAEYAFDRLGVRVPALLVSPWVERGVVATVFDHTSLLKYLSEKWELQGLGRRVAEAKSIGQAIRKHGPMRTDTPERIEPPPPTGTAALPAGEKLNGHQRALLAFSEFLERGGTAEAVRHRAAERGVPNGPAEPIRAAIDRVERFLRQKQGEAGSASGAGEIER